MKETHIICTDLGSALQSVTVTVTPLSVFLRPVQIMSSSVASTSVLVRDLLNHILKMCEPHMEDIKSKI